MSYWRALYEIKGPQSREWVACERDIYTPADAAEDLMLAILLHSLNRHDVYQTPDQDEANTGDLTITSAHLRNVRFLAEAGDGQSTNLG